jgi:hypothetical protein
LQGFRIGIIDGGQSAPEFRVPWVMRALVTNIVVSPRYADKTLFAGLPSLLGPELILRARERFAEEEGTRHLFQALAESVIADIEAPGRPVSTVLESMVTFAIGRGALGQFIDGPDLAGMVDRGLVRIGLNGANERIVVPRLPELLASEMALLLARGLEKKITASGPEATADWLIAQTSKLPLGDIIGAQAIFDCAFRTGSLPLKLIERLLTARPRRERIRPGTRAAMHIPGVGLIDLTFRPDGTILAQAGHNQRILEPEEDSDFSQEMYADVESWLILSYVAGQPFVAESPDGTLLGRVDPALLMEIGTCPIVLRRPTADPNMSGVLTHDLEGHGSIVCHEAGIVEPITMSMLKFLDHAGEYATAWIEAAVDRNSLALLSRIDIAMRHIAERGETPEAQWAKDMLQRIIRPAFSGFPRLH